MVLLHRFAAQFDRAPWGWVVPVAVLQVLPIVVLTLALTHPVPGGLSGCSGPHLPANFQQQDFAFTDGFMRGWSHAKHVRHELWNAAFLLALVALAVAAVGGVVRHHRLVKYQSGLALLCLVIVLLSTHAVDPVYYSAGC